MTAMPTAFVDADLGGATYRQLTFWVQKGYLNPEMAGKGSGYRWTWPRAEAQVARLMVRLVRAGLVPAAAAEHARKMAPSLAYGTVRLEVEPGVVLEVLEAAS